MVLAIDFVSASGRNFLSSLKNSNKKQLTILGISVQNMVIGQSILIVEKRTKI